MEKEKGKLIARGVGMPLMLNFCHRHHLTNENTILEFNETTDEWWLYNIKQD